MAGGVVVTNEVFVNCQVGYEVRAEAVCERGTAIAGRPQTGLYSTVSSGGSTPEGYWGGMVHDDFRQRWPCL
jgi:myo-inositol 2-dehydrogenase/D-chiro-inositol 1-dehydrogenase